MHIKIMQPEISKAIYAAKAMYNYTLDTASLVLEQF